MCACAVGDFCYEIKKPWNWFSLCSSAMRWLDAGQSCEEPSLWVWGQVVRLLWLSMVESRRSTCLSIAQVMIRFGHPKLARSERAIARGSGRDGERQSVSVLILHLCRTSPFWLHAVNTIDKPYKGMSTPRLESFPHHIVLQNSSYTLWYNNTHNKIIFSKNISTTPFWIF
jgi:hypothetical protein